MDYIVQELEEMASSPKNEYRYILNSFQEFKSMSRYSLKNGCMDSTYLNIFNII